MVMIALLATPVALARGLFACVPDECTMVCCHESTRAGAMCQRSERSRPCTMKSIAERMLAPLPPLRLRVAVRLPKPAVRRAKVGITALNFTSGYFLPPFEPPRA